MPSDNEIRAHIVTTVMAQVSKDEERRQEALADFVALSLPALDEEATRKIATLVPPLLPTLYEKWINMFVDRLLETVSREQIEELANGSPRNNATLVLIYIMFLESERMERQIDEDLRAYAREHSDDADMGSAVGGYIRAAMEQLGSRVKKRTQ